MQYSLEHSVLFKIGYGIIRWKITEIGIVLWQYTIRNLNIFSIWVDRNYFSFTILMWYAYLVMIYHPFQSQTIWFTSLTFSDKLNLVIERNQRHLWVVLNVA